MTMQVLISHISSLSVLLPLCLYFFSKKKKKNGKTAEYLQVLLLLLSTSALSDLSSFILYNEGYAHTQLVVNVYFTFLFLILGYLYYILLDDKALVYSGTALYVVVKLASLKFVNSVTDYENFNWVSSDLIAMVFSVIFYMQVCVNRPTESIYTYAPVWINTGVFFYFSFNLFLFMFSNYVFTNLSKELSMTFWGFHNVNNIVKNVLFAVGIYWAGKPSLKHV